MTRKQSARKAPTGKPAARTKRPNPRAAAETRQWIVVADHRQAHVYQNTGNGVKRVPDERLHCALPLPGGEADDALFLQDLAAWLDEATEEQAFDRLAIIAAPEALKTLHPLLDKKVRACICVALAKDVAKITEDEIEDHLADVVWL